MATGNKDYFWQTGDSLWYKDAVIYELHVRAFHDSDGDGMGDFAGLTAKLEYLKDLGVTAIWLLPFYPSPLKDDGYDIADYTSIHPGYGTMRDFKKFIRQANRHNLRVITELVLNHTSDQHPWFKRSRKASAGSSWRDFYVWSSSGDKYKDARIIFKDFEASNWSWDYVAKAYYWHRFYSHQPDLNFANPQVQRSILSVLNFWLDTGVSGLRLDAVPYLYEREGTNCENLPETHGFLKKLRRHVDGKYSKRMLLAEANQWAEDASAYFGRSDECHMAYHFPLMPRMFMAIRMEDRFPIIDILEQTPKIPDDCQWALFLRNHDELTLEMVTDEERDYMYRVYAHDAQARVNLGIRRRLAPLLSNDRRKIELMNGLLFSLPGTPIIYYGDEIGMGDNFYLGDRNGVRTPMQWNSDRNAGFSSANPQQLYLPVNIAPEYHYEAINVEAQQNNPDSLLWWMKRLISLRKRYRAFGRGTMEMLYPDNRKVLAFIRRYQNENILVLANLSHTVQHTSLNLAAYTGLVPVEAFGHVEFPRIGDTPYFITLGPYAFHWFSLESREAECVVLKPEKVSIPTITMTEDWRNLLKPESRAGLKASLMEHIWPRQWFCGKEKSVRSFTISDVISIPYDSNMAFLSIIDIEYTEGEPEKYLLPISYADGGAAAEIVSQLPQAVIAYIKSEQAEGIIYDAAIDAGFCQYLIKAMNKRRRIKGEKGEAVFWSMRSIFRKTIGSSEQVPLPVPLKVEQTNTSILYGDKAVLKMYRRLQHGTSPELEIGRFLTEEKPFDNSPLMLGAFEYESGRDKEPVALGILHKYVQNEGDAWQYTLDEIGRFFEQVVALSSPKVQLTLGRPLTELVDEQPPQIIETTIGGYLASVSLLGQRTAELHLRLASALDEHEFTPEPFSTMYQRSLFQMMRASTVQVLHQLHRAVDVISQDALPLAKRVLDMRDSIIGRLETLLDGKIAAARIRCHGNYHLGQVLYTGKDFSIIDFEGEPERPLSERRIKRCPLMDVADMIRSFHYAVHFIMHGKSSKMLRREDMPTLEWWSDAWYTWVSAAFLKSYLELMEYSTVLPEDKSQVQRLLDCYLLHKALREVSYEINNRPGWLTLPLQGILDMLEPGHE